MNLDTLFSINLAFSPNLIVYNDYSKWLIDGLMHNINTVLELPPREPLRIQKIGTSITLLKLNFCMVYVYSIFSHS